MKQNDTKKKMKRKAIEWDMIEKKNRNKMKYNTTNKQTNKHTYK